jgi:hypothetical protein
MDTAERIAQRDAYNWAGWQVDDDEPRIPGEPDLMASAQARRAWRMPYPPVKNDL